MDLTTTYLGLKLKNPLVCGASPLGTSLDTMRHLEESGIGAIVLPSLFEEEILAAVQGMMAMESAGAGFAEASLAQDLPSWIRAHVHALEFFGGVPQILVPDNTKTGVSHPCRYEPDINPTYQELAEHYGAAVIPARAGKPKDKAKVESAVLVAERWILAALRNHTFFGLHELNQCIA